MLKKFLTVIFALYCLAGVFYLALPGYYFPKSPPDSLQSQEPADLETSLRRGYFTDLSRAEVLEWYKVQFNHSSFLGLEIPTLLFNYPPENAQTIIRDQTRSTFLQEFAHPFRESIYINGFQPETDGTVPVFSVGGKTWRQKIIIRMVPSNVWVREGIFILSSIMMVVLYKAFEATLKKHG